jgi:hypothetical protein
MSRTRGRPPGDARRAGTGVSHAAASTTAIRASEAAWVGWAPWIAVAVALLVRLWAMRFEPWVTVDGTEYIRFAESLARGVPFRSIFPLGYPALIALVHPLVFDRVLQGVVVSLALGALLPLPVWVLGRRALGARWAALPALAVALHPALIEFSTLTQSESSYVFALYSGLALAVAARPLLAGFSLGAAFAIRPEALLPALALAIREAWQGAAAARRAVTAALFVAGFLVLAAPCWTYIRATWGEWTLTPKIGAFRAPTSWQTEESKLGVRADTAGYGIERVVHNAPAALSHYPANALLHGRSLLRLWPVPLLILSLWGLTRRRGTESIPLLHLLALPLLGLSEQPRFVLGTIPALAIAATFAAQSAAVRPLRLAAAALALAGAAWCWVSLRSDLTLPFDGYEEAHKEAGLWLGTVAEPGARVMDRKPYVAFYADREYRVLPEADYEHILAAAKRDSIRYLVVDEGVARVFRPQLLPLVYDADFRAREAGLESVYIGGHFKGYAIAIFRVLRDGEAKTGRPPRANIRQRALPQGS